MKKVMSDEEVSYRLVDTYFQEIARFGFKESLDLDSIINAYFYTLERVKGKEKFIQNANKQVIEEEQKLKTQSKEEMIPTLDELRGKLSEKPQ